MQKKKSTVFRTKKTKLKQGDLVIIICGKDKGAKGIIIAVQRHDNRVRVKIRDLNLVKKHKRGNPQTNESGGITSQPAWIDISNIMFYDELNNKRRRLGIKILDDGRNVRCYKKNGQLVEIEG